MSNSHCFGIHLTDDNQLVVCQRQKGQTLSWQRLKNEAEGLATLRQLITSNPTKPWICIDSARTSGLNLAIRLMKDLPRAEVALISPHFLRQRFDDFRHRSAGRAQGKLEVVAEFLAHYAERLV